MQQKAKRAHEDALTGYSQKTLDAFFWGPYLETVSDVWRNLKSFEVAERGHMHSDILANVSQFARSDWRNWVEVKDISTLRPLQAQNVKAVLNVIVKLAGNSIFAKFFQHV